MRKKLNKSIALVLFCIVFSINSFAAIISDNDGAAFITKAEFDAMKKDFATQVDKYNNSIDSKIDGAIASYLAGIRLSKKRMLPNEYIAYKLYTDQYIRDLKWTSSTTYNVNVADSSQGDHQDLWQDLYWCQTGNSGSRAGEQIVRGPGTKSDRTQNRIEVGKSYNIISFGPYVGWVTMRSHCTFLQGSNSSSFFCWLPVSVDGFTVIMRKSRNISQSFGRSGNYREYNYGKYYEDKPTDLQTLNMNTMCIAPLSTSYEGCLPPGPLPTDTTPFVRDNTGYGENKFGCSALTGVSSVSGYTITRNAWTTCPGQGGSIMPNLNARWFRSIKYNELTFDCIDKRSGVVCPMKCGLPVTEKVSFMLDDKVKVIVNNAASNGYLIPYIKETPDETWDNKKSTYTTDTKYKVTAGTKKEIELDEFNKSINGYVFVVWLPDTNCVMPDIDVEYEETL